MQRFRNRHPRSSPGRNRSTQQIQYQRKKESCHKSERLYQPFNMQNYDNNLSQTIL